MSSVDLCPGWNRRWIRLLSLELVDGQSLRDILARDEASRLADELNPQLLPGILVAEVLRDSK